MVVQGEETINYIKTQCPIKNRNRHINDILMKLPHGVFPPLKYGGGLFSTISFSCGVKFFLANLW